MSVSRNFGRTLSGATDLSVDNIRLPDNVNTIRINGNSGLPNQFLGKNATTGKLEWDFVETSSIPDNSIDNKKLKDKTIENNKIKDGTIIGSLIASDISFSTTGTIGATTLKADDIELPKTGPATTIIDSDGINMIGTKNITIDDGDFDTTNGNVIVRNGGLLEMFSDLNTTKTIILNGSNGEITCEDINVNNHTGTITFNNIRTDSISIPKTGDIEIAINTDGIVMTETNQVIAIVGNITTTGGDITATNGDVIIQNGGKVILYSDGGLTSQIELNGTNGNITSTGGLTSLYNTTISNSLIAEGNGIFTTDISGSSNANTPYTYTLTGSTGDISTNGNITLNTGNDLLINDGGKIDLFTDGGTTRTFDIDGSTGDLKIYNPSNGNERLELDGTSGNILVRSGGRIDMYAGNNSDINIELNGVNGIIDCVDINVLSHTGTIAFANIRTDSLTLPENGTATCELLSNGNIITNGSITGGAIGGTSLSSSTTISATGLISGGSITTAGNITATGTGAGYIGVGTSGDSYKILLNKSGIIECVDLQATEVDATTLDGDTIIFNTKLQQTTASNFNVDASGNTTIGGDGSIGGNATITGTTTFTGNMKSTNGNITLTNGDITLTNGAFRGEVIGDITEEHIHAQSLEIRDNGSGGGDTGIQVKDGYDLEFYSDSGTTKTLDIDGSNGNIYIAGNGNIFWSNNSSGEIIGKNAGSNTTNDDNTTQIRNIRIDESCFKYDTREIAMSKPTSRIERKYNTTSTSWSEINDQLYVKLKTNDMTNTNFIVEWSYYAVKDDGSRMWAKLYDIDATSPEDADQPSYLNNTKQVLFDGGADRPQQHHATFTLRNVSGGVDKNIGVCIWTIHNSKSFINFYLGPVIFSGNPPTGGLISAYAFGGMTLQIKKMYDGGASNSTPTGWSATTSTETLPKALTDEKLMSYSYIDNDSQNFVRIYNTSNKYIFDGNQNSGTDTLEVHFTATSTHGYLEFGFYANTLTAGMIFHVGVAVATGGTSPFSTTLTSSAVSIDGYKLGLFNGDTSRYSLKEILDFTSYENTYLTSKFHFNNLTIGTEYKMALYGRCNYTGSIYINAGGKTTTGTANRSAHQPTFLKYYQYDSNLDGARTDDAYVEEDY